MMAHENPWILVDVSQCGKRPRYFSVPIRDWPVSACKDTNMTSSEICKNCIFSKNTRITECPVPVWKGLLMKRSYKSIISFIHFILSNRKHLPGFVLDIFSFTNILHFICTRKHEKTPVHFYKYPFVSLLSEFLFRTRDILKNLILKNKLPFPLNY